MAEPEKSPTRPGGTPAGPGGDATGGDATGTRDGATGTKGEPTGTTDGAGAGAPRTRAEASGPGREPPTAPADDPPPAPSRLLILGTGALSVAFLPFWLNWLRTAHPRTEVRLAVTRSAERFVSRAALGAILGGEVLLDAWPGTVDTPEPRLDHVELAQWPDAVAVHPAGLHFVGRFAQGLADTPVLMALQCTRAVIGIAPALPPGAEAAPAYRAHLKALERYDNVLVAPPHPGRSASTGRDDASVAAPLPALLDLIARHRSVSRRTEGASHARTV
ncbi:flavoprotein [Streptomyces sp. NPDC014734]|uniref:flavoprotein n=1 Tax=Streptomyces sp. NPDC014734 TaxID=3364886 RepID=UPI0036FEE924